MPGPWWGTGPRTGTVAGPWRCWQGRARSLLKPCRWDVATGTVPAHGDRCVTATGTLRGLPVLPCHSAAGPMPLCPHSHVLIGVPIPGPHVPSRDPF